MFISEKLIPLLCRPLVKICLKSGVRIAELYPALKRTFVECAREQLIEGGHKINTTRISLMTGLQRPDVDTFMKTQISKPKTSLVTSLIGLWNYHHRFIGDDGKPRPLSFDGVKSEFARLVKMTSKELNPYSVLFELERAGVVEKNNQVVRLNSSTHLKKDLNEGLEALIKDAEDLSESIWQNISSEENSKNLHLRLDLDKIPAQRIDEVRKLMLQLGHDCLSNIQKKLSEYDYDFNPPKETLKSEKFHSLSFTIFSLTRPNEHSEQIKSISDF